MQTLSKRDGERFHTLFDPMLAAAYRKMSRVSPVSFSDEDKNSRRFYIRCADYIYAHPEFIDRYIRDNRDYLSKEDKQFISGIRHARKGEYFITHVTDDGAILLDSDSNAYLAKGIISDWNELTAGRKLPMYVETALLPYGDVIIIDGLMETLRISFTDEAAKPIMDISMKAEKEGKVIRKL